jgi:cell division protein FtsB
MFDFHEKRKIRHVMYSTPVISALFLLALCIGYIAYHRYIVAEEMQAKLDERRELLSELKQRAALLESKVEYLKDERGIEEEIRNRFDVAKEGEQVVVLVQNKDDESTSSPRQKQVIIEQGEDFFDRFKFWNR